MSKRQVTETFATIDEEGNRVVVTRVRNFQRVGESVHASEEVESEPELHADGEAITLADDDPVFRYRIGTTGKRLRLA